jgi:hypothetical protein
MNKLPLSIAAVALIAVLPGVGSAKGCLKGAAVGGVAGHLAGHHAVLGAAAGCVVGHHRAAVRDREAAQTAKQPSAKMLQPSVQVPLPSSAKTPQPGDDLTSL